MSAPITNTIQLVMSRVSEKEFDHELIETAIADIATHPFRKVQLRIPLRPIEDEEFVSFTNEMFGGHDNEDYSPIFAEMLSYNGNTAANAEQAKSKTFKVPLWLRKYSYHLCEEEGTVAIFAQTSMVKRSISTSSRLIPARSTHHL